MAILVSNDGLVRTISINRPDSRNAFDPDIADVLRNAFADFEVDVTAQVAILSGAGENFCAGFDAKSAGSSKDRYEPEGAGPMGPIRMKLVKPVIVAVKGYAVGGGLNWLCGVTSAWHRKPQAMACFVAAGAFR